MYSGVIGISLLKGQGSPPCPLFALLGATLAGSVYGDHCSPISDTTILASTGASCNHIGHVETQLPYATLVAVMCAVGYLIIGFTGTPWIGLVSGLVLLVAAVLILNKINLPQRKSKAEGTK